MRPIATKASAPKKRRTAGPAKCALIAVSSRCNMKCRFCFESDARCPAPDTASLKIKLNSLRENGFSSIVFIGGEATLVKNLPDIISHIRNLGMTPCITTNGLTLANKSYLEELLAAGLQHIEFSMHSNNPADVAFLCGRKDAFDKQSAALENMRRISTRTKTAFTVNINTVVTNVNAPRLLEMIPFFFSFPFVVASSLKFPTFEGRILHNTTLSPRFRDLDRLLIELRGIASRARKDLILDGFPLCIIEPRLIPHTVCFHDQNSILIGINYENRVFNDRFDWIAKDKTTGKCKGCALREICIGFPAKYLEMFGDDEVRPVTNLFSLPAAVKKKVFTCYASIDKKSIFRMTPEQGMEDMSRAHLSGYRNIELQIPNCGLEPEALSRILAHAEELGAVVALRGPAGYFSVAQIITEISHGSSRPVVDTVFPESAFGDKNEAAFKQACSGVMRLVNAGAPVRIVVPVDTSNAVEAGKFVRLAAALRAGAVAFEQISGSKSPQFEHLSSALKKAAHTARDQIPCIDIEFRGFPPDLLPEFHYLYRFGHQDTIPHE